MDATPTAGIMSPGVRRPSLSARTLTRLLCGGAALAVALAMLVELRAPLRDDVAWLLHVAAAWLDGQAPYRGLIEVNPPPAILVSTPPVLLARALGVPAPVVAPFFFLGVLAGCAWLTADILHRRRLPVPRAAAAATILATCVLLPLGEFGERDHLIAAMALPYLALHAGRPSGRGEGWRMAVAGALVGLCCGMKPHYAPAFAAAGLATLLAGRAPPWRAAGAAAASLLALAGGTLLLAPAFLDRVLPLALDLYVPVRDAPPVSLTLAVSLAAYAGTVALWARHRRALVDGGATGVLLAFALGAWLAYFLQDKGWFYHRLPALVATALALLTGMATVGAPAGIAWHRPARHRERSAGPAARRPGGRLPFHSRPGRRAAFAAALMLLATAAHPGLRAALRAAVAYDPAGLPQARLAETLRRRGAATYVAYSVDLSWGFPLVQAAGVAWTWRFPSTWALRAEHDLAARSPRGRPVRDGTVADFLAACPDVVAVSEDEGMDYLALLRADPGFAAAWALYRPIEHFGGVEVRIHARSRGVEPAACGRAAAAARG